MSVYRLPICTGNLADNVVRYQDVDEGACVHRSQGAKILNVKVENCSKLPCVLVGGTTVSFAMDFTANMDITSAHTRVYAYLGAIRIPYALPDPNSCNFMKCPIKNGGTGTYKQNFEIPKIIPVPLVVIEWEILSGNSMLTCFEIKATVK